MGRKRRTSEIQRLREQISADGDAVIAELVSALKSGERLCVVKAPPGSGKTYTLIEVLGAARSRGTNFAVATQTNAQCDDLCRRYAVRYGQSTVYRFAAKGSTAPADLPGNVRWITDVAELPSRDGVVVATTAKWGSIDHDNANFPEFDVVFVDEAWQMKWADFMLLGNVSGRFVLIGDPGQIAPVVTIPVNRWETSPRAPHMAAPEVILSDPSIHARTLELTACRRLPADSVELVRPFYDFDFHAWAASGDRFLRPAKRGKQPVDPALDMLVDGTTAIVTIPTPSDGPPLGVDLDVAALAAEVAVRALKRKSVAAFGDGGDEAPLEPSDIGIAATHRVVNSAILAQLPAAYVRGGEGIRVDTPERWQGLERKLMIVVHPLSGVVNPSSFDLETGRLCVMASRHQSGMVVVSRDHVPETLATRIPVAEQAVGRPDIAGRGHHQHSEFWAAVADRGRVIALP